MYEGGTVDLLHVSSWLKAGDVKETLLWLCVWGAEKAIGA